MIPDLTSELVIQLKALKEEVELVEQKLEMKSVV